MFDGNWQTTFWDDFTIADHFGVKAIKDTYNTAFNEWKDNVVYLTELVIVLNWKIWDWYERNEDIARVYNELWETTRDYAYENLKGDDLNYFWEVTD